VPAGVAIDTLVLGCTHYPFEAQRLQSLLGLGVRLVETGAPVARRTREVLGHRTASPTQAPRLTLLSTRHPDAVTTVAQRWLGVTTPATAWSC
jgi:glutamate racemase